MKKIFFLSLFIISIFTAPKLDAIVITNATESLVSIADLSEESLAILEPIMSDGNGFFLFHTASGSLPPITIDILLSLTFNINNRRYRVSPAMLLIPHITHIRICQNNTISLSNETNPDTKQILALITID